MPTPTDPRTITLAVSHTERDGYFQIHAKAWIITATGKVEYPRYDSATIGGIFLTDFTVSCQGHNHANGSSGAGRLYAWAHGYDVTLVTAENAGAMAKSLGKIERRLDKLATTRGSADSFAEYLTRVAEAIGATELIERKGSAWDFHDDWRRMALGDGRRHVAHLTRTWADRVNPPTPAQAASA